MDGCDADHGAGLIEKKELSGNDEECQKSCNRVSGCNFFLYKRLGNVCFLFNGEMDALTQNCKQIGGPKQPKIASCRSLADPCYVSISESVHFILFIHDSC